MGVWLGTGGGPKGEPGATVGSQIAAWAQSWSVTAGPDLTHPPPAN
jgi:hypothetical protein